MRTRELWLLATFAVTRVLMAVLAGFPQVLPKVAQGATADLNLYFEWAQKIVAGLHPYTEVTIEYPPGALPFIVAPGLAKVALHLPYRLGFIGLMMVIDAAVLWGLERLSRQRRTESGMWLWVIGLPLLGPVCWSRLDLVPALTTVWALERLAAGRPAAGGAWLGFGAVVKVYPAFLLASALTVTTDRARLAVAAVAAALLILVPLSSSLPAAIEDVVFYHAGRGIQIDSTWSNVLLLSRLFGHDVAVDFRYGAFEVTGGAVPALKILSTILSVGVVAGSCVIAYRRLAPNDAVGIGALWFAVISWLLVTGSVLSPQFLIWLLATAAGSSALAGGERVSAVLLLSLLALTQVLYPFLYVRLTSMASDAVMLLTVRNVLLAAVAVSAARKVWFRKRKGYIDNPRT